MSQYKTGTISINSLSTKVTGSGTDFVSEVNIGDVFNKKGETVSYVVGAIDSATTLTLSSAYAGSTVTLSEYQITRDFTPNLNLNEIIAGDVDYPFHITEALRDIDSILGALTIASNSNVTQTKDTVQTTVLTIPLTDNQTYFIDGRIVGRGIHGTNIGKGGVYKLLGAFKRYSAGAAQQIGLSTISYYAEDVVGWDALITTSGNNVLLKVVGDANTTISWKGTVLLQTV